MNTRTQANTQNTLTVGEVRRRQAVTKENASGFGHLQVDHVSGVLQGCDSLFMAHLLQTGAVHLHTHTTESVNTAAGSHWPTGRKGGGVSQPAACLRSAASRPCGQRLLR